MRSTTSPQLGRIEICEDIKQKALDDQAFHIKTDHPEYDVLLTVKISGVCFLLEKPNKFGDPQVNADLNFNMTPVPKKKKE